MKILGIIAEYNPFHNGHKYQIAKAKELTSADAVVVVMSGNFVERGAPACADKWDRCKWALENGVDLVVELPVIYALSSAEQFAFAGVYLLNAMKCDYISFGVETNIEEINKSFEFFKNSDFSFDSETPFHIARTMSPEMQCIKTPNNILAFEYIKALDKLKSKIIPVGITRCDNGYNSTVISEFSSATAIRQAINEHKDFKTAVPESINLFFNENSIVTDDMFVNLIKYAVLHYGPEKISKISEVREGIENKIYKVVKENDFNNFEELVLKIKSKRYTYSAISRMLFKILLDIEKDLSYKTPEYIRILGTNETGSKLLKNIKKTSSLPVITKPADYKHLTDKNMFEKDILATDIYNLVLNKKGKADLTTSPVITF